jgi:DNA-binding NarL/FixJ family response regulator
LNSGTFRKRRDKGDKATLLIASAVAGVRRQWAQALKDFFVILEVFERAELEQGMADSKPSVLFLDLDLPQLGEIGAVSSIQRLSSSTKIIVLSSANDEKEAISALKAGAVGYCNKDIEPSLLRKAVKVVQEGETWVGRKTISRLLAELTSLGESHQEDGPVLSEVYLNYLTPREQQIALLIGNGAHDKEIAGRLNISERTVKAHLTAIFQKLQIPDRLRLGLFVAGHNHEVNHYSNSIRTRLGQSPKSNSP